MNDKYEPSEKKFVNPYHFVGLQESCSRKSIPYKKQKGKLTGWIQCQLESLTPVFIPNTSSASECDDGKHSDVFAKDIFKEKENKRVKVNSYDFFSYTDLSTLQGEDLKKPKEPVIPGSEIRGVIRSAFETVTNSCLSTIADEQLLYKRVQTPGKAARLVFDKTKKEWALYECNRHRIHKDLLKKENNPPYKEGEDVYVQINFKSFKVIKISRKKVDRFKNAFLHLGEYNENKNYESVFMLKPDKKSNQYIPIKLSKNEAPAILNNLIQNVLLYRAKENKTENHNQYRHFDRTFGELKSISNLVSLLEERKINYEDFLNTLIGEEYKAVFKYLDGALVYYAHHDGRYYLSPAAIGREVFYNKLTDIIKRPEPYKGYEPCEHRGDLCPACALFGMAGKHGAASRVRFTDARTAVKLNKMEDYYDEVRILKELAGPKLSAAEFYLKQKPENAHLWNYDYSFKWERKNNKKTEVDFTDYLPEIRGRKFYWHQLHPDPYIEKEKENDHKIVSDRNVAVRALRKGITFDFKVYFNEITESELKRLLWVLTIKNRKENAHKIGMGKPLGMGSIKITVTEVMIRDILMNSETIEYTIADRLAQFNYAAMNHEEMGCSQNVLEEFLFLTQLEHSFSNIIAYPSNVGEEVNYKWFMENKRIKGTGTNPIIENPLPDLKPQESGPELPRYQKKTSPK
jgi:CRISPR-associated protein (TIGR03986 family)